MTNNVPDTLSRSPTPPARDALTLLEDPEPERSDNDDVDGDSEGLPHVSNPSPQGVVGMYSMSG